MFKLFAAELAAIADTWPEQRHDVDSAAPDAYRHPRYVGAVSLALQDIHERTSDDRVKTLTTSSGVAHGMNVIARYYQHATESAAEQGVPYDDLVQHLGSHTGFDVLSSLATNSNRVATAGEDHLCIRQDIVNTFDYPKTQVYRWTDGTLTHPLLDLKLDSKREELQEAGRTIEGKCHAEKAHQLQSVAASVLSICSRDEQLMPTTYDLNKK